ncbi:MAG: glutamyl-tRNA reductase [Solirubrobacteraceae bacterium]|jgi:glutamyl-tRNA reductase|nr:glutamyl-tRNA reductase [Solirubrobacteraceae bacterium]
MSELLLLGTSYKSSTLELRERLALTDSGAERFLSELRDQPAVQEAVVVSTCNRTELYLVAGDPVEAETVVVGKLARRAGVRPTELLEGVYSARNCDAARHLYRVVCGLESMVVGEAEIQGQVKRAYELALGERTTGPLTNKLFRAAMETGKRVRTETGIGAGRHSIPSVAVELAQDALGDLRDRHTLIVGAGETAELTAEALHAYGVATLFVANRRRDRAETLAQRFDGSTASFDELPGELLRADIVLCSTASSHPLIEAEDLAAVMAERGGRPLLLIDLAVPRDVEPAAAEIPGVTLANIDSMRAVVDRHRMVRRAEARRAEGVVEEEIQRFAGWLGSLEVMPTIAALRGHADAIVGGVVSENAGRFESERDRERAEAMARAVAKRLLHEPTQRVRAADEHRHARMHVLRELFGLEEAAGPAEEAAPAEVRQLRPR